ncbi:T9SS type A sorting domain-containing protein [Siccationidurans soli]|uniref:T9SS type A sorting domain-containing protein n=1 Tax=Hymenobacter negativus TaxID=2795026 RepID=A0ABS3QJN4_9BACT|nr:T9SS type A sorting domain-containing protein [Hymenobacter negativus]
MTAVQASDNFYWGDYTLTVRRGGVVISTSTTSVYPLNLVAIKDHAQGGQTIADYTTVCQSDNILFVPFGNGSTQGTWSITGGPFTRYGTSPTYPDGYWVRPDAPTPGSLPVVYTVSYTAPCTQAPGSNNPSTITTSFHFVSVVRTSACGQAARTTMETPKISTYPSPAGEELTVQIGEEMLSDVQLVNSKGQEVKQLHAMQKAGHFNVSDVPNGLYLLQAQPVNGQAQTVRVMIQH